MIIQRIQSIYLLLTFVFALLLVFTPMALPNDLVNMNNLPLAVVALVLGAVALIAVFLFKNYKLQLNLTRLLMLGFLVLTLAIAYFIWDTQLYNKFNFEWLFSPLAIITSFLAGRGIANDIQTIKSMDRLR